jgi:hypothetical protein
MTHEIMLRHKNYHDTYLVRSEIKWLTSAKGDLDVILGHTDVIF